MGELIDNMNYVQMYWLLRVAVTFTAIVVLKVFGVKYDVKQSRKPVDQPLGWIEFRKRNGFKWMLCLVTSIWMTWHVVAAYCMGAGGGGYYATFDKLVRPSHMEVGPASILLACVLCTLQFFIRTYVSYSISIYSRRQTWDIFHAFLNYSAPLFLALALVAEGPEYADYQDGCFSLDSLNPWTTHPIIGLILFGISTYLYIVAHQEFAKLRKNRFGHITTTDYKHPKGGIFDVICCPQYLAEILFVLSINTVLGFHAYTWCLVTAFTVLRQYMLASSTHEYYSEKFESFPKNMKMLIPYLL